MTNTFDPAKMPAGVSLAEWEGGLTAVRVHTDVVHGEVCLLGAHVVSWQPADCKPVLWMSRATSTEVGKPIRGGIPVCFPWFGAGVSGDQAPGHGFLRLVEWRLVDAAQSGAGVRLVFEVTEQDVRDCLARIDAPADLRAAADELAPFRVRYAITFGAYLKLDFTVENTGTQDFTFEEALHTYFRVGHVREVRIEGLGGAEYFDKVTGEEGAQQGELVLTDFTDRVYRCDDQVTLQDPGLHRAVLIYDEGAANTVVWNPWRERSEEMADIHEGAWPGFVCIESANALKDAVTLAPGEKHTMKVRIDVENKR